MNQFEKSIEIYEAMENLVESLRVANAAIDWDDPEIKREGFVHLAERECLEAELVKLFEQYGPSFEEVRAQCDPDYHPTVIKQTTPVGSCFKFDFETIKGLAGFGWNQYE